MPTGRLWPVADRRHPTLTDRSDLKPAAQAAKDASMNRMAASKLLDRQLRDEVDELRIAVSGHRDTSVDPCLRRGSASRDDQVSLLCGEELPVIGSAVCRAAIRIPGGSSSPRTRWVFPFGHHQRWRPSAPRLGFVSCHRPAYTDGSARQRQSRSPA